jgi:uncharacterized protein (TIGR04255 family)
MGKMMKNAPVYFTIGQVRYNPVLSLVNYLPIIQEHFRKSGFPDFKKGITMAFNLTPFLNDKSAEGQPPTTTPVERYSFSNLDNTENFLLEQSALAFQTTEYENFDIFADLLIEKLDLLHKTVGLSFVERIGVRYLDAVMPQGSETLNSYLIPEVMGLYGKLKGQGQHSFSETQTQGDEGSVISRTVIQQGQIGFPPDLLQLMNLKVASRFTQFSGTHAVIDTDAFLVQRIPFDLADVRKRLHTLHKRIDQSFYATVTEHALASWA